MDNLHIYNQVKKVPQNALKPITAGRLKGKSDINPMWRLKVLTQLFGPCGIGWKYVITKQWLEPGGENEVAAFVNIDLFVRHEGEWSEAIPGTGGSSFVTQESRGVHTSDECYKMALTDAISVACKALGVAAEVYWQADTTKYVASEEKANKPINWPVFWGIIKEMGFTAEDVQRVAKTDKIETLTREKLDKIVGDLREIKIAGKEFRVDGSTN